MQGGYGNPALNMLENKFKLYGIGGIKLSWYFGNLYTKDNEIKNIEMQKQSIDVQEETFLFNTNFQMEQEYLNIEKMRKLLRKDERRKKQDVAQKGKQAIPEEAGRGIGKSANPLGRRPENEEPYDPHHDDTHVKTVVHPYIFLEETRTEDQIIDEIRKFSATYSSKYGGQWSWQNDNWTENNCHSFIFNLLYDCKIADRQILNDKHFKAMLDSTDFAIRSKTKSMRQRLLSIKHNAARVDNNLNRK